jgi:hypothetical protein
MSDAESMPLRSSDLILILRPWAARLLLSAIAPLCILVFCTAVLSAVHEGSEMAPADEPITPIPTLVDLDPSKVQLGQSRDDVLGDAIAEDRLVRLPAEIVEWKYRDGGSIWSGRLCSTATCPSDHRHTRAGRAMFFSVCSPASWQTRSSLPATSS